MDWIKDRNPDLYQLAGLALLTVLLIALRGVLDMIRRLLKSRGKEE